MSTYSVEVEKWVFVPQKRRNEYVLLQKREEISIQIAVDIKKMSTIAEVQDHKKFPRSKPRNKQGNDEEEKDAHIIIIENPFEWR